ncbi:MAG: helix-turn-helix domain-containing protein [Synechococcales cyanobacterium CRU_2_2]|nr:helix-turn-helix domain-containing protein [Synechococcales cyanobacterium CRU_2_2]
MKKPNLQTEPTQATKLAELGDYLRQARRQQSMTLEDVSAKTKVQVRLLRAIEDGHFERLPESVYVKGFIRKYADVLGLNGQAFADAYPTEPITRPIQSPWRDLPAAQLRPIHLYLLYLVLVLGAVSGLSQMMNRPGSAVSGSVCDFSVTIEPISACCNPANPLPDQPDASEKTDTVPVQMSNSKPVRVGVKLTDSSWLRVVVDGKTTFEGVLPQGDQRTWAANKQLTLRAGNAGGDFGAEPAGQLILVRDDHPVGLAHQRGDAGPVVGDDRPHIEDGGADAVLLGLLGGEVVRRDAEFPHDRRSRRGHMIMAEAPDELLAALRQ